MPFKSLYIFHSFFSLALHFFIIMEIDILYPMQDKCLSYSSSYFFLFVYPFRSDIRMRKKVGFVKFNIHFLVWNLEKIFCHGVVYAINHRLARLQRRYLPVSKEFICGGPGPSSISMARTL